MGSVGLGRKSAKQKAVGTTGFPQLQWGASYRTQAFI